MAVTQFLITGLEFVPTSVWVDGNNCFFATPSAWFSMIREGWESSADELIKLQDAAEDARFRALAQRLARHPKSIVVLHARLFDAVT